MLIPSNKIILIDDSEEDLYKLSKIFHDNGIGCRCFKYDSLYNNPLTGVRVAFLDINLNGPTSDSARYQNLETTITNYISKENGCFVLVFWTSNTEWIKEFIDFVNRDENDVKKYIRPFYITFIDKSEFLDGSKDFTKKIEEIFDSPAIRILLEFEDQIQTGGWNAVANLINTIPSGDKWGDTQKFEQNCKDVFAAIACQSVGVENAKEDPDSAIKEAIIPIIEDNLRTAKSNIWKKFLTNLPGSSKQNPICFPDNFKVEQLNTVFHIDKVNPLEITHRGAVCPVNCTRSGSCDLFTDCFAMNYCDWFNTTFPGLAKNDRNNCTLIALELSAACDYANNKKRTNRYLLGVILPQYLRAKLELNKSRQGDYLLILPFDFEYEGGSVFMCFNMNFIFTLNVNNIQAVLQTPIFYLKKEMVDYVGSRFAQHASRLGTTYFSSL